MDPVVRNMFDELIQKFDAFRGEFDSLDSRLEKRLADAEASRQRLNEAVDGRLTSLEHFASSQYTAAVVADNWGGQFSDRVTDLEQRVLDLELIRFGEIRDECDDRVAALESAAEEYQAWRPQIESSILSVWTEVERLSKLSDRPATSPPAYTRPSPELISGRAPAGFPTDWPSGHGEASPIRETGFGSVTTKAPFPANGTF